jgi:hypothetical protein
VAVEEEAAKGEKKEHSAFSSAAVFSAIPCLSAAAISLAAFSSAGLHLSTPRYHPHVPKCLQRHQFCIACAAGMEKQLDTYQVMFLSCLHVILKQYELIPYQI